MRLKKESVEAKLKSLLMNSKVLNDQQGTGKCLILVGFPHSKVDCRANGPGKADTEVRPKRICIF